MNGWLNRDRWRERLGSHFLFLQLSRPKEWYKHGSDSLFIHWKKIWNLAECKLIALKYGHICKTWLQVSHCFNSKIPLTTTESASLPCICDTLWTARALVLKILYICTSKETIDLTQTHHRAANQSEIMAYEKAEVQLLASFLGGAGTGVLGSSKTMASPYACLALNLITSSLFHTCFVRSLWWVMDCPSKSNTEGLVQGNKQHLRVQGNEPHVRCHGVCKAARHHMGKRSSILALALARVRLTIPLSAESMFIKLET